MRWEKPEIISSSRTHWGIAWPKLSPIFRSQSDNETVGSYKRTVKPDRVGTETEFGTIFMKRMLWGAEQVFSISGLFYTAEVM